jgi:DNA-binding transcriptional ArsR family regulator
MWKNLWAVDQPTREMERQLVSHFIQSGLFLEKLVGDRIVGGVALEAYFSEHQEVTADYVSLRVSEYVSPDTARRRMMEMTKAGIMTSRKEGRTVHFKLNPEIAEAAIAYLKGETIVLPSSH